MKRFGLVRKTAQRFGAADGPVSSLGPNAGTLVVGTGGQTVPAYFNRLLVALSVDAAATGVIYGLCGSGTPSATNFHFSIGSGQTWPGPGSQVAWSGPIQLVASTGTIKVGVFEV